MERSANGFPVTTIEQIEIDQLFGRYDYVLRSEESRDERLLLLYGDNGVGKSTILRLVFDLLSPASNRSHRTRMREVPFRRFAVRLSDGVTIAAERSATETTGDYSINLSVPHRPDESFFLESDDGIIRAENLDGYDEFQQRLIECVPFDVYFLGDTRELQSDHLPVSDGRRIRRSMAYRMVDDESEYFVGREEPSSDPLEDLLENSIQWLRRRVIEATQQGSAQTNSLYLRLLTEIARPSLLSMDPHAVKDVESALSLLAEVSDRTSELAKFGLLSGVDYLALEELLEAVRATDRERPFLEVLVPYLASEEAKSAALTDTYGAIESFVSTMNSFLVDKWVSFSMRRGISILVPGNRPLETKNLSSGERQLLTLFASLLFVRSRSAIFLVDEPEMSLNVKWQRRLIDALLGGATVSPAQFIMASHSFEIISSAPHCVIPMERATLNVLDLNLPA